MASAVTIAAGAFSLAFAVNRMRAPNQVQSGVPSSKGSLSARESWRNALYDNKLHGSPMTQGPVLGGPSSEQWERHRNLYTWAHRGSVRPRQYETGNRM